MVGSVGVRAVSISSIASFVFFYPRPAVSALTTQRVPFLKPVVVSATHLVHQQPPFPLSSARMGETGPAKMALYSLTGNASSPFHAEPACRRASAGGSICLFSVFFSFL